MTTLLTLVIGAAIMYFIMKDKVQDHTDDSLAMPCPICGTASPLKTMGYHFCPKCKSRWHPTGAWIIRFKCGCCKSSPIWFMQDLQKPELFRIKFECGREGTYNNDTKAKCDYTLCKVQLEKDLKNPVGWITDNDFSTPRKNPPKESQQEYISDYYGEETVVIID